MDSFEASTQFAKILKNLAPSLQSLTEAAYYALKNSESEDYLFPIILEILDDSSTELNTKATIFNFIEVLMHESFVISQQPKTSYSYPYVHNIKNALPGILLKVLPGSNNIGLHNTFKCLKEISKICKFNYDDFEMKYNSISKLFNTEDYQRIEANIPFPAIQITPEMQAKDSLYVTWEILLKKKKQSQYERIRLLKHSKIVDTSVGEEDMFSLKPKNSTENSHDLLSRAQILSRMEDDRETHKRSKENSWLVNRPKELNYIAEEEFLVHYWNKIGTMNEVEEKIYRENVNELNKIVLNSYKDKQF